MTRPLLVARLSGGLGNQMFIYAAARRLAIKNDAELALDQTNGFVNDPYQRFFQLDLFKLKARNATPREAMQPFNKMRRKLAIHRNKKLPFSQRDFIKQNGVDMEPALLDAKLGPYTYLEGYWQGEPYFADIADIIRQDFQLARQPNTPNMAMLDTIKQYEMPVALHVRFFAPPGAEKSDNAALDYYRKAMAALEERVSNPHYFIFSDRPHDAVGMLGLPAGRFTTITHNDSPETAPYNMWLMSQCRHFIIANSTFSWWGAWLGSADNKIVFAPALTTDIVGKYASWGFDGLLPDDWEQIQA